MSDTSEEKNEEMEFLYGLTLFLIEAIKDNEPNENSQFAVEQVEEVLEIDFDDLMGRKINEIS